ncbi:hypothetical protein M8J75_004104 [Diaphorina citri]|nr:hypothetical protein M8J75_004104 [Diaphorina citri]
MQGVKQPPMTRLLAVIQFYATGNFQIFTGDSHGVSQPTMCRLVKEVSKALAQAHVNYVKFPEQLAPIKVAFQGIGNFPGVVGCVDCTHVPIQLPSVENGENYRNRKGTFSLNVQVIGGPNLEIWDVVSGWPGSVHDSRIFTNSRVCHRFERGEVRGILLGDSGYAQNTFLYTPLLNPTTPQEQRYNKAHIKTRNSVERLFGIWKRRFACLRRKLANSPVTCTHIVTACAVLHNIAVQTRQELPAEDEVEEEVEEDVVVNDGVGRNGAGAVIRRAFINEHFA